MDDHVGSFNPTCTTRFYSKSNGTSELRLNNRLKESYRHIGSWPTITGSAQIQMCLFVQIYWSSILYMLVVVASPFDTFCDQWSYLKATKHFDWITWNPISQAFAGRLDTQRSAKVAWVDGLWFIWNIASGYANRLLAKDAHLFLGVKGCHIMSGTIVGSYAVVDPWGYGHTAKYDTEVDGSARILSLAFADPGHDWRFASNRCAMRCMSIILGGTVYFFQLWHSWFEPSPYGGLPPLPPFDRTFKSAIKMTRWLVVWFRVKWVLKMLWCLLQMNHGPCRRSNVRKQPAPDGMSHRPQNQYGLAPEDHRLSKYHSPTRMAMHRSLPSRATTYRGSMHLNARCSNGCRVHLRVQSWTG